LNIIKVQQTKHFSIEFNTWQSKFLVEKDSSTKTIIRFVFFFDVIRLFYAEAIFSHQR